MNIINKGLLKLVMLPSPLYRRMGVNTSQLEAILAIKLTMDDRRVSPLQQTRRNAKSKPPRMATIGTMFLSALLGVIFIFFLYLGANRVTQLTFYFCAFFLMLS